MIQVRGESNLDHFKIEQPPSEEDSVLFRQRDRIVSRLLQRGSQTRNRLIDNLDSILPRDMDALLDQFEGCGAWINAPCVTLITPPKINGEDTSLLMLNNG